MSRVARLFFTIQFSYFYIGMTRIKGWPRLDEPVIVLRYRDRRVCRYVFDYLYFVSFPLDASRVFFFELYAFIILTSTLVLGIICSTYSQLALKLFKSSEIF